MNTEARCPIGQDATPTLCSVKTCYICAMARFNAFTDTKPRCVELDEVWRATWDGSYFIVTDGNRTHVYASPATVVSAFVDEDLEHEAKYAELLALKGTVTR